VVGDRLDTDIAGAVTAEVDALLVLTGASTPAELLAAPAWLRPRYVAKDISAVRAPGADVEIAPQRGWEVERTGEFALSVRATGGGDPLSLLRTLCAAHRPIDGGDVVLRGEDDATRDALRALGIARSTVP
jgi:hypothetical protein